MVVFDENTCNKYPEPGLGSKGSFVGMLCHSRRPYHIAVKRFIEDTFSRIISGKASDDLRKKLQCEEQFQGAFFELLVFHFLEILEHKCVYQPDTLNCHPDFLVEPDIRPKFIIDAKAFRPRDEIRKYRNNRLLLEQKIRQCVKQPYAFHVVHLEFPSYFDAGNAKKWAEAIDDELKKYNTINPAETIKVSIPGSSEFFKLHVEMPRNGKPHYLGSIGKGFGGGDSGRVRHGLLQKVKEQYKQSDLPIVFAVGESQSLLIEIETLQYALYGDPALSWDIESSETEAGLRGNGLFLYDSLESETRKKISAVVGIIQSPHRGQNIYDVCIFHNPCANVRLEPEIFSPFYQVIYDVKTGVVEEIGDKNGKIIIYQ